MICNLRNWRRILYVQELNVTRTYDADRQFGSRTDVFIHWCYSIAETVLDFLWRMVKVRPFTSEVN